MQRIRTLLQKINDLSRAEDKATILDIDLMMDYTRVLYADLAELRSRATFNNNLPDLKASQLEKVENTALNKTNIQPTKSLEKLIGINDKYLFISELFGNNKTFYDEILQQLNHFENYTQADNWLKSKCDWEDDNETVLAFRNVLQQYYN